ncbi:hypothetical protein [Methylobacterium sp. J-067]|uniref:hypothetical protein n=1 Tax=Methylobacterium sp. J-067 TaxID=2836648 RepID=UPI001FBBD1AB|nr:hypothetical protein [Methylobacterium sp. J-067]MCJ2023853.1 hypothetical protein [Methylobacterium sp. J-067]
MTATIIFLKAQQPQLTAISELEELPSPNLGAALLELWRRRDELLAVIEGLRRPSLATHARFGPLVASLEALAVQGLVEVDLLIREVEQMTNFLVTNEPAVGRLEQGEAPRVGLFTG